MPGTQGKNLNQCFVTVWLPGNQALLLWFSVLLIKEFKNGPKQMLKENLEFKRNTLGQAFFKSWHLLSSGRKKRERENLQCFS